MRTPAALVSQIQLGDVAAPDGVEVVRSTETKLVDQWSPPLDCPGSVGTHGEAAGEHGGTARELMRHKACLTR